MVLSMNLIESYLVNRADVLSSIPPLVVPSPMSMVSCVDVVDAAALVALRYRQALAATVDELGIDCRFVGQDAGFDSSRIVSPGPAIGARFRADASAVALVEHRVSLV